MSQPEEETKGRVPTDIRLMMIKYLGLSRKEVMNEMLAFLVADYRITSNSLVWFIYFISKNLQIQTKIKEELAPFNGHNVFHLCSS